MEIQLTDSERTKCSIWCRVMGYWRPLESYNRGKKSEYYERKCFTEEKAIRGLRETVDNELAAE